MTNPFGYFKAPPARGQTRKRRGGGRAPKGGTARLTRQFGASVAAVLRPENLHDDGVRGPAAHGRSPPTAGARPGHARGPFVEGLDRREVRDGRRTDPVARIRRRSGGQPALVLEHGAPGGEAASLVEREPLFGRIEQHVAPVRRLKQPIEEPRAVATALCGGGDDDHAGAGIGLSVVPPHGRADHFACPLQDQAMADRRGELPVLSAIGPGRLLRQAAPSCGRLVGRAARRQSPGWPQPRGCAAPR